MQPFPLCKQEKEIIFTGCGFLQFPDTGLNYIPYLVYSADSFCRKHLQKWKKKCCLSHCYIHNRRRKDKSVYTVPLLDGTFFHLFSC